MPTLYGMATQFGGGMGLELALASCAAALVWIAVRRTSWRYGLAAMLTGSLLTSHHAYLADCAMLAPAALIVIACARAKWLRGYAILLLTPVCYILMLMGEGMRVARFVILAFLVALAWAAWRGQAEQEPDATSRAAA